MHTCILNSIVSSLENVQKAENKTEDDARFEKSEKKKEKCPHSGQTVACEVSLW